MQTLDVISVNIWQIVISLLNLLLMFLILKHFLFKPVKKMMDKRREELENQYKAAEDAQNDALKDRELWESKLAHADAEADEIRSQAVTDAKYRSGKIIAEAKDKAGSIMRQAEVNAELEMQKAQAGIKDEIVNVSAALTEKMLGREINTDDHRGLIESFIGDLGDDYD